MARKVCNKCNKALPACICKHIKKIANPYQITILQDPSETNKALGTARILFLSLSKCRLQVGDIFAGESIDIPRSYLVYPGEGAMDVKELTDLKPNSRFILLDGSWKKAHKLLKSNPALEALPKVSFTAQGPSNYRIRKSPRADGLSTVEAGYYLLSQLENNQSKYLPLLETFNAMIEFQISQIPPDVYQKNYPVQGK